VLLPLLARVVRICLLLLLLLLLLGLVMLRGVPAWPPEGCTARAGAQAD
jgi:hypothetical protein